MDVIELVLSHGNPDRDSLVVKESKRSDAVATLVLTNDGLTTVCNLLPDTVDRLLIELAILKNKFQTGGYVIE
jgi:hypothetical protein